MPISISRGDGYQGAAAVRERFGNGRGHRAVVVKDGFGSKRATWEDRLNMLSRLAGMKFRSLVRREFDWVVHFDAETSLVIECLWRLVDSGRIRLTSEDDGHQFGLPAPIDAAAEVTTLLSGSEVESVDVREGLLDLDIRFGGGRILQVMPNSSGYEAWHLTSGKNELIAAGGGTLATYATVEPSARSDRP